jgi:hypothetical protein
MDNLVDRVVKSWLTALIHSTQVSVQSAGAFFGEIAKLSEILWSVATPKGWDLVDEQSRRYIQKLILKRGLGIDRFDRGLVASLKRRT